MRELGGKNFKTALINMVKNIKEHEDNIRIENYGKEPKRTSRTEKIYLK